MYLLFAIYYLILLANIEQKLSKKQFPQLITNSILKAQDCPNFPNK